MVWLRDDEKMMICLAVLTEYRRVTDRWQTDGQTDGRTDRYLL